jgi:hypothetical protein
MSGDRRVLGPFETASEALLALRPADGSFLAPGSRLGLLTETLRAAGVELGQWDREVARWLAELDFQTIAPVIGWVSRAGREPAPGVIVQALADAIAYQTALTSHHGPTSGMIALSVRQTRPHRLQRDVRGMAGSGGPDGGGL